MDIIAWFSNGKCIKFHDCEMTDSITTDTLEIRNKNENKLLATLFKNNLAAITYVEPIGG